MPEDCTPTGNQEWTGPWEYVGAAPGRVVGSLGPMGATGIAMEATYVWRRPFKREFVCCEGNQQVVVWVEGNYAVYTVDLYDAGFPVKRISVGFPAPAGILSTLSDVLGASVSIADWWVSPSQADGHRPGGPGENEDGNGAEILAGTPKAQCGQWVELPDGTRKAWGELQPPPPPEPAPPEGETPPPGPTLHPPVENRCCANLDFSQRKPVLEFDGVPQFRKVGGSWTLDATIRVRHECELEGPPRVEYALVQQNPQGEHLIDLTGLSPRLYTHRWLSQHQVHEIKFDDQQVPDPGNPPAGKIRMRIVATSKCGGVLDATFTIKSP